jgi:hypothetical protein
MESEDTLIKGSGISNTLTFIKSKYGQVALDEVLAAMPDASRQSISTALATGWYPVEYIGDLISAMKGTIGKGSSDFIYTASTEAAKATFNLIYKVFFKLGSPGYIIGKVASVWRTLVNKGDLAVVEKSDKHIVVRLTDFPYKNSDYCGERLRGWFRAPLELSGCQITEAIHTACTSKGSPYCEWRFRW